MPRNTVVDLNNILFAQLERLDDEELTDEELDKEIKRSKAITSLGKTIIKNASLALDAAKLKAEYALEKEEIPEMLEQKTY